MAGQHAEGQAPSIGAIEELIRRRGGRATAARRAVIGALLDHPAGMATAEDLASRVHAAHTELNESTVHRTLTLLEEMDVAHHVHLGHGPAYWYLGAAPAHWHLTCEECGAVVDIDAEVTSRLAADIAARTGFRLLPGHFAIAGTCPSCQRHA